MITDETLAKAAQAAGVTPLAEQFGVKIDDSNSMLQEVALEGFYDKLAQFGKQPRNEQEAEQLLELGTLLLHKQAQAADDQSEQPGQLKEAIAQVRGDLKLSPEAASAEMDQARQAYAKVAHYAEDPDVAAHLTARFEAINLLS